MAKLIKPLTDIKIRNAKPGNKLKTLFDGGGLYLAIMPGGSRLWRMKYRHDGKAGLLSFGKYPDVSLEQARSYRDEARKLLANGVNPSQAKRAQKAASKMQAANSFEVIAREWFARHAQDWAVSHANKTMSRLENYIFPFIGGRPITELTAPEYLAVFRKLEERNILETAHRVRSLCGQIQRYAIATGRAERNPIADLAGALPPSRAKHMAAITEPAKVAELLRAMEGHKGTFVVSCALRIAPYVFVRPGELRQAKWADIDFDKAEWRYTVSKTKTDHIVPLAHQVVAILKELHQLTGQGVYVFPSERGGGRPMSDAAIIAALRSVGIPKDEMTGHGFRAMARTSAQNLPMRS
jgi:integrase